jgi:hypothetical protein
VRSRYAIHDDVLYVPYVEYTRVSARGQTHERNTAQRARSIKSLKSPEPLEKYAFASSRGGEHGRWDTQALRVKSPTPCRGHYVECVVSL